MAIEDADLSELLEDFTPYTGEPLQRKIAEVLSRHAHNGRGWCGTCRRMVISPQHQVEMLEVLFTIREKPTEENRQGFMADLEAGRLSIAGDWLVVNVGDCNCGAAYGGAPHEPGCGYEPVAKLIDIL